MEEALYLASERSGDLRTSESHLLGQSRSLSVRLCDHPPGSVGLHCLRAAGSPFCSRARREHAQMLPGRSMRRCAVALTVLLVLWEIRSWRMLAIELGKQLLERWVLLEIELRGLECKLLSWLLG